MSIERFQRALENPNVRAFLAMLRFGEGTSGPDGYRVLFGGELFDSFDRHPQRAITRTMGGKPITSSAAGAYQFIGKTWAGLQAQYGFTDFSPTTQDIAAVALIDGRGALDDVLQGRFEYAVRKCNREWASLPESPYGQPTVTMTKAKALYMAAGGQLAPVTDAPVESDSTAAAPVPPILVASVEQTLLAALRDFVRAEVRAELDARRG